MNWTSGIDHKSTTFVQNSPLSSYSPTLNGTIHTLSFSFFLVLQSQELLTHGYNKTLNEYRLGTHSGTPATSYSIDFLFTRRRLHS